MGIVLVVHGRVRSRRSRAGSMSAWPPATSSRWPMTTYGVVIVADFELPGEPMDLVFRNESEGYLTLEDGTVARFVLPGSAAGDGELEIATVAAGLHSPRGIGIVGDALIVAELGPLPCEQTFPCKGENVDGASSSRGGRTEDSPRVARPGARIRHSPRWRACAPPGDPRRPTGREH